MRGKTDGFPKKMKSEFKKQQLDIIYCACAFVSLIIFINTYQYSITTLLFYGLKELSIRVIARGFTTCIGDDG